MLSVSRMEARRGPRSCPAGQIRRPVRFRFARNGAVSGVPPGRLPWTSSASPAHVSGPLDSAGNRKNRSPVSLARNRGSLLAPPGVSVLIAVGDFCHANAATCQNSRELPQIASNFRHVGLPAIRHIALQNAHIQALSALDRTQEVAGSSPASSTQRIPAMPGILAFRGPSREATTALALAPSLAQSLGHGSSSDA